MNRQKFILACIALMFAFATTKAADDNRLKIEVIAPQLPGKTIKLVNYFNGSNYTQDSVVLSKKGTGNFEKNKNLPEGLYIVYIDTLHFFDMLLADDQNFKITIDTTSFIMNNKIEGSEQSEAFLEYAQFIYTKQRERARLADEYRAILPPALANEEGKEATDQQKKAIVQKTDSLHKLVLGFQKDFGEKHKDQWVGKFFKGLDPITTGPYPFPRNKDEGYQQFLYLKHHYFDNVNLTDRRFWYTNYFPGQIDKFMNEQIEPDPDSLANAADWLVQQSLSDSICFRLMLGKLTNYASQSDLMGMENIWAKLAEEYYLKGLVPNLDSTFKANLNTEYRKIKHNRIGMTVPNMVFKDSTGKKVNLYDVCGKFTLIYFFEPGCGHCKKTTPLIHDELYKRYHDMGFNVACICVVSNRQEWMGFVNQHKLFDWSNLWDPDRTTNFWEYFDTSTTPGVYLVDEDKKIVAKKLDEISLDHFLASVFGVEPQKREKTDN